MISFIPTVLPKKPGFAIVFSKFYLFGWRDGADPMLGPEEHDFPYRTIRARNRVRLRRSIGRLSSHPIGKMVQCLWSIATMTGSDGY